MWLEGTTLCGRRVSQCGRGGMLEVLSDTVVAELLGAQMGLMVVMTRGGMGGDA